jgi:hypothetical protein
MMSITVSPGIPARSQSPLAMQKSRSRSRAVRSAAVGYWGRRWALNEGVSSLDQITNLFCKLFAFVALQIVMFTDTDRSVLTIRGTRLRPPSVLRTTPARKPWLHAGLSSRHQFIEQLPTPGRRSPGRYRAPWRLQWWPRFAALSGTPGPCLFKPCRPL